MSALILSLLAGLALGLLAGKKRARRAGQASDAVMTGTVLLIVLLVGAEAGASITSGATLSRAALFALASLAVPGAAALGLAIALWRGGLLCGSRSQRK